MKKIIYILYFLPLFGFSQPDSDSLYQIWENKKLHDTTRLKAFDKFIQGTYLFSNPDTAYILAQTEFDYAQEKKLKREQANALNIMGISKAIQGEMDLAIEKFEESIELRRQINDLTGVANSTNNLGLIYSDLGENKKAIGYFEKSLKIYEEKSNYKGMTSTLGNMGVSYHNIGDYRNAIYYYSRSLKLSETKKDDNGIAITLNNIAIIHLEQKEYDLALEEFNRCMKIFAKTGNDYELASVHSYIGTIYQNKNDLERALKEFDTGLKLKMKVGDKGGVGNLYSNIGIVYRIKKDYEKALNYFKLGLENNIEGGMLQQIAGSYNNLGNMYFLTGNISKAIENCEKAFQIATEHAFASETADAAESLWRAYKKSGNNVKALEMFEKFISTRDSLKSEDNQKAIIQQQYQYQYEKQAAQDSVKNAEQQKVKDAQISEQKALAEKQDIELQNKRFQQLLLFGGLGLVLIFSIFIFNRFRVTQKQKGIIEEQKHMVEEKNKEITDSITYAKRIQSAILPPDKLIKEHLPHSFVLYKPKDIVAGDFYWLETVVSSASTIVFLAACDCTGHGVPGAMVSVVCNNGLNRSVREYGLTDPGKILDKTRELVIQEFEKSEEEVKDGMDISLANIEITNNEILNLKWAGANNPLWLVRNGELTEYKANKQPIGKYTEPKPFTTHEIKLMKGDSIYIFTDGFQDQFGGEKGKKFKASKLKELLLSVQEMQMNEQKSIINDAFEKWRGNLEQNDDVCVIGMRI